MLMRGGTHRAAGLASCIKVVMCGNSETRPHLTPKSTTFEKAEVKTTKWKFPQNKGTVNAVRNL